jgi:thioredoxin-related protein
MSDIENEKELREIMRELNATNLEEKKRIDFTNHPDEQKNEWQIADAFKVRFMNNWIFWVVGFHVVLILYIWLR